MGAARGWDVDPYGVHSLEVGPESDPVEGRVVWDPVHSLWNGAMTGVAVIAAPLTFSWSAIGVFLVLSGVVLIAGHSVGYHRRLIHRSFACPKWVERILVWVGALVGLGGPLWTLRVHDLRDWGQRQADCHPALRHAAPVWTDYLWNLHGRLILARPPRFAPAEEIAGDRFLAFLERTWMLHQVPLALLLYAGGGWSWVVWGSACGSRPASPATGMSAASPTARAPRPGSSRPPASRPTTCRGRRSRPWARPGTTTTTPFRVRRRWVSIQARRTGGSG
jgi:stearoyl-CoA desaturase (delta-9 desaturase)